MPELLEQGLTRCCGWIAWPSAEEIWWMFFQGIRRRFLNFLRYFLIFLYQIWYESYCIHLHRMEIDGADCIQNQSHSLTVNDDTPIPLDSFKATKFTIFRGPHLKLIQMLLELCVQLIMAHKQCSAIFM